MRPEAALCACHATRDAVLDLLVTEAMMQRHPDVQPGELTSLRQVRMQLDIQLRLCCFSGMACVCTCCSPTGNREACFVLASRILTFPGGPSGNAQQPVASTRHRGPWAAPICPAPQPRADRHHSPLQRPRGPHW